MKIIHHGRAIEVHVGQEFSCGKCHCQFALEEKDKEHLPGKDDEMGRMLRCPECKFLVATVRFGPRKSHTAR